MPPNGFRDLLRRVDSSPGSSGKSCGAGEWHASSDKNVRALCVRGGHSSAMKGKIRRFTCIGLACLANQFVIANAGPLKLSDVMQDAAWVAHLDCDNLRSNSIGKFLLAEMEKPEHQQNIAA